MAAATHVQDVPEGDPVQSPLCLWLSKRLHAERVAVLKEMEKRHLKILRSVDNRLTLSRLGEAEDWVDDAPESGGRTGWATHLLQVVLQKEGSNIASEASGSQSGRPFSSFRGRKDKFRKRQEENTDQIGNSALARAPEAGDETPLDACLHNSSSKASESHAESEQTPYGPPQSQAIDGDVRVAEKDSWNVFDADHPVNAVQSGGSRGKYSGSQRSEPRSGTSPRLPAERATTVDNFREALAHMEGPVSPSKQKSLGGLGQDEVEEESLSERSNAPSEASMMTGYTKGYKNKALRAVSTQHNMGRNALERFVNGHAFEVCSAVLIVCNTFSMAFEAQYKGMELGYMLGDRDYTRPADDIWPGAGQVFDIVDVLFTVLFSVELLLRIWAWKLRAFTNMWVVLDSVIVLGTVTESLGLWPFDTSTLRLVRLLRIVRVLRVAQAIHAFDTLFLLVKSLVASVGALFWSFVVLLLLQLAVGMLLSQVLHEYMNDESQPKDTRVEVFYYFGTFNKMVLTMFEITFANWVPSCRFFVDNVSPHFVLFYIFYRNMICFAVIRVIAAIFICETNRIAAADLDLQIRSQTRLRDSQIKKLRDVFSELDTSGDGCVEWDEFKRVLKDDLLKVYLRTVEVEVDDLRELFEALDTGDGKIRIDDFVAGILRCKGNARAVDLLSLHTRVKQISRSLNDHLGIKSSGRPLKGTSSHTLGSKGGKSTSSRHDGSADEPATSFQA